jgi:hypothetical protein
MEDFDSKDGCMHLKIVSTNLYSRRHELKERENLNQNYKVYPLWKNQMMDKPLAPPLFISFP